MDRPLGAQISHMLKARGVDVIFGIPGVHNIEMYRGIEEAGIRHILARHEQGAGFMADGYARASGRPAVAYVITGPGLTNILTPMGQAYSDSVPMLVISSCLDPTDVGQAKGKLHEMRDQEGAAATVCDWSKTAHDAAGTYHLIDRALMEFRTGRARPKHIQVPIGVLGAMARGFAEAEPVLRQSHAVPDVSEVARLLMQARRPLFIFGGGARWTGEAVQRILGQSGAASFTTYAGRGLVATGGTLCFGSYLARPDSARVLASADLVVVVGAELAEVDLWRDKLGSAGALVRVDIDPATLASQQGAALMIHARSEEFLAALADGLATHQPATDWTVAEVDAARARWRAEVDAERPGVLPVAEALRAALPAGTTIYSDMTQFAYVSVETWDMEGPGLWHHPSGFATLGYAMPAAIGGKVALPDRPVMAIAGDYGFQYTVQELGTAVELGLPLPIIVWDNGKLKEIEDSMRRSQIAPNAVVARNPDFSALARAYGAHAVRPGSLGELPATLSAAFAADRPTLIHLTPEIGR